jgi:hypothetical protein
MKALINQFLPQALTTDESRTYEERERLFNRSEAKRALPDCLKIGDFVDYNESNKWKEARIS